MNIPLILDIKGSKNVLFYLVINQSKFTAVYKVNCILKQTQVERDKRLRKDAGSASFCFDVCSEILQVSAAEISASFNN